MEWPAAIFAWCLILAGACLAVNELLHAVRKPPTGRPRLWLRIARRVAGAAVVAVMGLLLRRLAARPPNGGAQDQLSTVNTVAILVFVAIGLAIWDALDSVRLLTKTLNKDVSDADLFRRLRN